MRVVYVRTRDRLNRCHQVPRTLPMLQPQSLEDLCVDAFLTRLETDAVALIGVAQSGSSILR